MALSLKRHYENGAPAGWQEKFISSYATAHPWEDWAETWAHYLHMTDALETAAAVGVSIRPQRENEPSLQNHRSRANLIRNENRKLVLCHIPAQ